MSDTDRIERSVEIDADAKRVWDLVSEPGWYINDGRIIEHRIERDGEMSTVHDPQHGAFRIRTVTLEEPRYAAFRWLDSGEPQPSNESSTGEQSTLVEFWIDARPTGGVTLRVVESGFDALDVSAQERRKRLDDNTEGWELELAAARTLLAGE